MIKRLSQAIVSWQIKKNILAEDERALYQYAYEVLLNQGINILVAVFIAVIFQAPIPVFVFLVCYIPLRSFCGGYHASTHERCTVVSAILICFVCWITKLLASNSAVIWSGVSFLISGITVFILAPVPDLNKPLDENESVRYRKVSRIIWAVEAALGLAFSLINQEVGFVMAVSHLIMAAMLFLGSVKNKIVLTQLRQS